MNETSILETQYRIYDGLLAFGFFACFVIGLPGNCLALRYFVHTKKRNLSTLLYIVACSIDIGSSVIHLPFAFNLLNNRTLGLLSNTVVDSIWNFIILLLQEMSMFVVMTLSLSRAIVIKYPFYNINKRAVLVSIAVYLLYRCSCNCLLFFVPEMHYNYAFSPSDVSPNLTPESSLAALLFTCYMFSWIACSGISSIIVFLTFLVSIFMLQKEHVRVADSVSQRRNQHASITITYFTALFLCCNCFFFISICLLTYTVASGSMAIYDNDFMSLNSWIISEIFCTVLNASLTHCSMF